VGGTDSDSCPLVGFDIRVLNLPVYYTRRLFEIIICAITAYGCSGHFLSPNGKFF
jgi:hypothetical protein